MPKAVTIIRAGFTATGLRQAAAFSNEANAARRMLGLALVLEGYTRGEAARLCGMDRQTLRDWVIRYNAEGVAGLSDRTSPGPKPRLKQSWFAKDRTSPRMVWCAGAGWIWPA